MHTQARIPSPHTWPCAATLALCACGTSAPATDRGAAVEVPRSAGWVLVHHEDFEDAEVLGAPPPWTPDSYPDDGPFSDRSAYFLAQGIEPPAAYRRSLRFGEEGWLTVELYSRAPDTALAAQAAVVADPGGSAGRVLRVRSPAHTDAAVVRPTRPLPPRYRISLRVGHADFGDGVAGGLNGHDDGGETAEPWLEYDATRQNGFYWLAILDAVPRPHNNLWMHHHRKVVIDSDNHFPPWMEIHDGTRFVSSGQRPIMMFALDGRPDADGHPLWGKPFLSFSAGKQQPSGAIRAVDSYRPRTWYEASIERNGDGFVIELRGDFAHGGKTIYRHVIDATAHCVWHYNRPGESARPACLDDSPFAESQSPEPRWPAGRGWPDYFFFGDPHNNFYEGQVFYDDVRLEVWRD